MLQFAIFVMVTGAYAQDFNVTHLIIPDVVPPHQIEVELECWYQGNFTVLSWFKGPDKFFRYRPGTTPSTGSFPIHGIGKVELAYCGPSVCRLRLGALTDEASGFYRCDIERDVVPYKFASKSAHMQVLRQKRRQPLVEGLAKEFDVGVEIRAYCRTENSTEVIWYINGMEIKESRGSSELKYKVFRSIFLGTPPTITVQCAEEINGKLIGSKGVSATLVDPFSDRGDKAVQQQKCKTNVSTSNKNMHNNAHNCGKIFIFMLCANCLVTSLSLF